MVAWRSLFSLVFTAFLASTLFCASSRADLPSPRLDRLIPLGAAAGSQVEVEILGADLEEVKTLLFDHPGLKADYLKERRFRITIAADVPTGTYDVRLVGRFGVSNPRLFAVSHRLLEIREQEPNNDAAMAQTIPVNSIVNGLSDSNQEDFFRLALRKRQRVVIECQAQKLDSPMDATLTLFSAEGKLLASNSDYYGRDPLLDFRAPQDGDYVLSVHDLIYRGGLPYRLVVTDQPHIDHVFPCAVQAGQPAMLAIYGRNLGETAQPSPWLVQDLPLEVCRQKVLAPAELPALAAYRFFEHPTRHSVLPTAATCTLTGFQFQTQLGGFAVNASPLLVVDVPVSVESEPNDEKSQPQKIHLPAVVSGRFDRPRDADWYEFEAPENGPYAFEVYCERIAGQADPYLVLFDDKGNRLVEMDDFGQRINAFDGHLRDVSGLANLTGKQRYRVLIQDRYRRGGARCHYVFVIRKPRPDFYVAAIHPQNPGPAGTNVRRGGAAYLDIIIHRQEGWNGPITLIPEGLPPGLHASHLTLQDNHGTFVFWADATAPEWTGTIKLWAQAKVGDKIVRHEVRPYTRVWAEANIGSSRPMRNLVLASRASAPFALRFEAEQLEVKAGSKVETKLRIDRLWPECKDILTVQPLSFPGSIRMSNVVAQAAQKEITLPLEVNPGTPAGEYTLTVIGQTQVPYSKDATMKQKPTTLVVQPAPPLKLIVKP
jgi:hypothetical protein